MSSKSNWADIKLGMWVDTLLELHPNSEWVKKPTVLRDLSKNMKKPSLIVTYHYDGVDVVLEYVTANDPIFGEIAVYAVQEIIVKESNGKHRKHKSKGRRKKRR